MYSVFATNCKSSYRLEFLRKNTDVGRRSIPHRLCSLINFNTRKNTKRRQIGGGKPGPEAQAGIPYKANALLKGREIVSRDYPDHDHPKLLEHVADQPANTAATAVRKSPAGSGAVSRMSFVS